MYVLVSLLHRIIAILNFEDIIVEDDYTTSYKIIQLDCIYEISNIVIDRTHDNYNASTSL